jgi:hypothetical protein
MNGFFILFFFIRKEPKENRRRANRSPFPALLPSGRLSQHAQRPFAY